MVCVLLRHDLKAAQEEAQAVVASWEEAEWAWWAVVPEEACVTGKVMLVWTGALSIHRGTGVSVVEDMAGEVLEVC